MNLFLSSLPELESTDFLLLNWDNPNAIAYSFFEIFNYVIILICSLGFLSQLFFFIFSFLKNKSLPKSDKYHRIAIIIPVHNEAEVIEKTIHTIKTKQKYPMDLVDIFVCCHNCTDNSYEICQKLGVTTLKLDDPDPRHALAVYPLDYILKYIIENKPDYYDFVIKMDADNILDDNFLSVMNDGYSKGYKACRGYLASTNLTQNNWTKVSGLYYMRDSRISCQVREAFHLSSMLDGGAGMMLSMDLYKQFNGYGAKGGSDDIEITLLLLYKRVKIHYLKDAIVYNDQPSTFKDTFNRNSRMGHGLNLLFLKHSPRMIFEGIFTGKISLIDLFLQLLFIPTSFISFVWLIPYYVTILIFHMCNFFVPGGIDCMNVIMSPGMSGQYIINILMNGGIFLLSIAVLYIIETVICTVSAKKVIKIDGKKMVSGIFLSPLFMLLYNVCIFAGIVSKPKWKKLKRNVNFDDNKPINPPKFIKPKRKIKETA